MMTAPLPLAVLGGGLIGRRHAALAMQSDACRLTALAEPDAGLRARLGGEGFPVVADLQAIPPDTRAVITAAPTALHAPLGAEAAARGWAVLMEKPVAPTLAEADALIAACARAGAPLLIGHHRRHHGFVAQARAALAAGALGRLVLVQGIWSLRKPDAYFAAEWRVAAGGGPVLINLIHDIDLIRHLVGEISEITAMTSSAARDGPVEDSAAVALRFANGALGSFAMSDTGLSPWGFEAASGENPHIAGSGRNCLRFAGTEGALDFPSLTLWRDEGEGPGDWSRPLARMELGLARGAPPPLAAQLAHFIAVARGEAAALIDGADGRATLAATLAVRLSAQTGRMIRPDDVPETFNGQDRIQGDAT